MARNAGELRYFVVFNGRPTGPKYDYSPGLSPKFFGGQGSAKLPQGLFGAEVPGSNPGSPTQSPCQSVAGSELFEALNANGAETFQTFLRPSPRSPKKRSPMTAEASRSIDVGTEAQIDSVTLGSA
jgi:hypothetical protein